VDVEGALEKWGLKRVTLLTKRGIWGVSCAVFDLPRGRLRGD